MDRQPSLQPPSVEAAFPSQAAPPTSVVTCGKRAPIAAIFEIRDLIIVAGVWKCQCRKSSGSAMVPLERRMMRWRVMASEGGADESGEGI